MTGEWQDAYPAAAGVFTRQWFAMYVLVLQLAATIACVVTGATLAWRRPDDWMVLLSALILIWAPLGFGLLGYTDTYTSVPWRYWRPLSALRQFANAVGIGGPHTAVPRIPGRPFRPTLDEVGAGACNGDDCNRDGRTRGASVDRHYLGDAVREPGHAADSSRCSPDLSLPVHCNTGPAAADARRSPGACAASHLAARRLANRAVCGTAVECTRVACPVAPGHHRSYPDPPHSRHRSAATSAVGRGTHRPAHVCIYRADAGGGEHLHPSRRGGSKRPVTVLATCCSPYS